MTTLVTAEQMKKITGIFRAIQTIDYLLVIPLPLHLETNEKEIDAFYKAVSDVSGLIREVHELNPDPGCDPKQL